MFLTSTTEVGRNISSLFSLNIISTSMTILEVLFGELEMILFPTIIVYPMNILLNLSDRGTAKVKRGTF